MDKHFPGKIIVVANQKGGVAKTTTTGAIASILVKKYGYKVLCLDMDPQANLTDNSGTKQSAIMDDVLRGRVKISDYVVSTSTYDILPSSISLAAMEQELSGVMGRECKLAEAISSDPELNRYDFILIDTPPSLSTLTVASLVAADEVIIPTTADLNASSGINQLGTIISGVKQYFNNNLKIHGIVFTRFDPRLNISKQINEVVDSLAGKLNTKVFSSSIRQSVNAPESAYMSVPIIEYNASSTVAKDYMSLTEELLSDWTNANTET